MPHLELTNLPAGVYERIADRAKERGKSVEQEVVEILQAWATDEDAEAAILAAAKANRDELAKKGVFATDEDIRAAIEWGRS